MKVTNAAKRMRRYYHAYYQEVQSALALYPPVPRPLPDAIRKPSRIQACFAEDGVAVIFWDSTDGEECEFEHRDYPGSLRHFANTLARPSAYAGLHWQAPPMFPGPGMTVGNVEVTVLAEVVTDIGRGTILPLYSWRAPWRSVQVFDRFDPGNWREDIARLQANNNVLQVVTAHLMRQQEVPADQQHEKRDAVGKLQEALDGLRRLLDSETVPEALIQKYLSRHEALWTLVSGASEVRPQVPLGSEYRVDFSLRLGEREYILVEIEAAHRRLFTQKGDPSSDLSHALRQVGDWREWVSEQLTYARTLLPGITDPECWVIMGRRHDMSDRDLNALRRKNLDLNRIEVMTYDDLLDSAVRRLDGLRRL